MIKRKINLIVVGIILLVLVIIALIYFYPKNEMGLENFDQATNNSGDFVSTNTITMFRETGVNTGNYEEIWDNSLLTEDYVYNSELSNCANGSSVSWDTTKNKVLIEAIRPDNCYVYFDKIK